MSKSSSNGWRRGIPTRDVIDAQVQYTDAGPIVAFQARHYGFHATVCACFDPRENIVRFDMTAPLIGATVNGQREAVCVRVYPLETWEFRPVDVWEGDPLPWREPTADTVIDWAAECGTVGS